METCDEGVSSDGTSSLLGKGSSGDSSGFGATIHEGLSPSFILLLGHMQLTVVLSFSAFCMITLTF